MWQCKTTKKRFPTIPTQKKIKSSFQGHNEHFVTCANPCLELKEIDKLHFENRENA